MNSKIIIRVKNATPEVCLIARKIYPFSQCLEAYSVVGKTHLHQQMENRKEHVI